MRLLVRLGADPDVQDVKGLTPLTWALNSVNGQYAAAGSAAVAADCHDERVSVLVELVHGGARRGLPVRPDQPVSSGAAKYEYRRSLLHACSGGLTHSSLALLRRLLRECPDADVNAGAGDEGSPLDLAVHAGWPEGALLLLNAGADVNSRDSGGSSPLMRAASLRPGLGGSDLIRLLVEKRADVTLRDAEGATALHYAARYGRADAARTLRALSALRKLPLDLGARDADNRTAADVARALEPGAQRAALLAVLDPAKRCPPRSLAPGEDAACDAEEVAVTVHGEGVELPEEACFITTPVEAPVLREVLAEAAQAEARGPVARCCDCVLCIPGSCPCLVGNRNSKDAEVERQHAIDKSLPEEAQRKLDDGHVGRALRALRQLPGGAQVEPFTAFATAHQVARGALGESAELSVVATAAALLALHRLLCEQLRAPLAVAEEWEEDVRRTVRKERARFCAKLAELLLALDDAAAEPLAKLVAAAEARSEPVPVWQAAQARAWLREARPAWRASVRLGAGAALPTCDSLVDAMLKLRLALRSVHDPLRAAPPPNGTGLASLRLCSPHCPCAGGGCRAAGVQLPLMLRTTGDARGLTVLAGCDAKAGALVAPYVAELTSCAAADAAAAADRAAAGGSGAGGAAHFFCLDLEMEPWAHLRTRAPAGSTKTHAVLDAGRFGSVARFLNHACGQARTLARAAVTYRGLEGGPLVFLYLSRDVKRGDELTWNYGSHKDMGFTCMCAECESRAVHTAPPGRGKARA